MAKDKGPASQPFIEYSPEVEARRAEYERIAAAIATLFKAHTRHVECWLDIDPDILATDDTAVLLPAIMEHMGLVTGHLYEWHTPEGQRLYVESRLLADQHQFQLMKEEKRKRWAL